MSAQTVPPFDLDTAVLLSQLCLEDIDTLVEGRKGKKRYDALPTDEEVALGLQRQDLLEQLGICRDARIARSLSQAAESDRAIMERILIEEQAFADDHLLAQALSEGRTPPQKSAAQRALERTSETDNARYVNHYFWIVRYAHILEIHHAAFDNQEPQNPPSDNNKQKLALRSKDRQGKWKSRFQSIAIFIFHPTVSMKNESALYAVTKSRRPTTW
jgi:hypothetical protein